MGGLCISREVKFVKGSVWKGTFHESKGTFLQIVLTLVLCSHKNKPFWYGKLNGTLWLFVWFPKSLCETMSSTTREEAEVGLRAEGGVYDLMDLVLDKVNVDLFLRLCWSRQRNLMCPFNLFYCFKEQPAWQSFPCSSPTNTKQGWSKNTSTIVLDLQLRPWNNSRVDEWS